MIFANSLSLAFQYLAQFLLVKADLNVTFGQYGDSDDDDYEKH